MTTNEQERAIQEWHEFYEETSYFTPRPQLDFVNARYVFCEGFDRGYFAATTEANKRIAELEREVAIARSNENHADDQRIKCIRKYKTQITELQASNNNLREALEHADEFIRNGIEFGYIRMPDESLKGIDSAHDTPEIIRKALSATPAKDCQYGKDVGMPEYTCVGKCQYASTPAESLQAHDDEVIEKCAKVCESINKYTQFQTVEDYKLANEAARNIRSLKEVK